MDSDIGSGIEIINNCSPLEASGDGNGAVVVNTPSYASLVPEEEQADDTALSSEFAEALVQGVFSPASGMAQIQNALDGKLYAAISVDEKGDRTIEFCQKYDSGEYSPKVTVPLADLRFAAMYNFIPEGIPVPIMKARLAKFLEQVTLDYLGRVSEGKVYQPVEILSALMVAIDQLPVFRTNRCGWTPETLYAAVMDMVNGKTTPPITPFGEHKAFMAFADFQIENMAEHLEMKSGRELLKLLDQYHLLYLTNSSRGYQSRVYVDGNNRDWAYCVYRAEYIAEKLRTRR